MLAFFRKYQRYIYTSITVMIIISFSFFGTYGAITEDGYQDPVVFTAVDGTEVHRSEVERMALFIGTDSEDMVQFGGIWGPNFFNDGVIEKNFLKTGIASILAEQYQQQLKEDIDPKVVREMRFEAYRHPSNPAISAEEIWVRYNPQMVKAFQEVQRGSALSPADAFEARVNLYLAQRSFTGQDLKQAVHYVEQMNGQYMQPDPNLAYSDLSLFGYRTTEDWFGPKFVRLISEFIIQSSKIAEAKGYSVPKEEVLADLARNAERSFQQTKHYTRLGATSGSQYFQEQLRRMHLDQTAAVKTWRQVMLFRRMFEDIGSSVVTDPFIVQEFQGFAGETMTGEQWALPANFNLGSFRDLALFETYLKSVAPKRDNILDLPANYLPKDKIPSQLVELEYRIEFGSVDQNQLQTRVGIREMWNWQTSDEGWSLLTKEFPELVASSERAKALENVTEVTRSRLDAFSRKKIVETKPEWIAEALSKSPKQQKDIAVREEGGSDPLPGVQDRIAFMEFLNSEDSDQPRTYSPDQKSYYIITVVEKSPDTKIMTFAEAKKEGVLAEILDSQLQTYYERIRDASPKEFQMKDGSWKELTYVRDLVSERYFAKLLEAIEKQTGAKTPDAAAAARFLPYVKELRLALQKGESDLEKGALEKQWELVATSFSDTRSNGPLLEAGTWSEVASFPNGAINFRKVVARENKELPAAVFSGVEKLHQMLSDASERTFAKSVIAKMQENSVESEVAAQ